MLLGPDGETVVVRDYFSSDAPPVLITEGGSRVPPDLAEALTGPAAPAQLAQADESEAAPPIGQVQTLEGTATATRADGTEVTLTSGSPIFQGDVIETGSGASVGVVFVDTTTFSLGEDGRMVMDELVFDPESGEGNSSFSVVQGVFSFVSGQIAKSGSDAMSVRTPVATIGIRGTRVAGQAQAEGEVNTITLLPNDDGTVGELSVSNDAGTIVLNVANQTTQVLSFSQPPAPPVIMPAAQIQALYGSAVNALPPQPANPPQIQAQEGGQQAEAGEGEDDDLLDGGAGFDFMDGGSGDDVLVFDPAGRFGTFGGSGNDTLRVDGAGITVDLPAIPNGEIGGIEIIDLTGSGNNSLLLTT
ncbi:MAG TPA: FecR domain-containing protein, partial [Alphaproteobacteria bacterium]|nr:FecR domain-containing protein [Alphaproteobacteria bacterium]